MIDKNYLATTVARGAALLDEKVPGWYTRVNVETLKMESCVQCMLGQLFGHNVETALGTEMYGLPIDPTVEDWLSVRMAGGHRNMTPEQIRDWYNRSGYVRGMGVLNVDDQATIGCGGNPELVCHWAKEIDARLTRDAAAAENSTGASASIEGGA